MPTLKSSASKADMEAAFQAITAKDQAACYMDLPEKARAAVEKVVVIGLGSIDPGSEGIEELGLFLSEKLSQLDDAPA